MFSAKLLELLNTTHKLLNWTLDSQPRKTFFLYILQLGTYATLFTWSFFYSPSTCWSLNNELKPVQVIFLTFLTQGRNYFMNFPKCKKLGFVFRCEVKINVNNPQEKIGKLFCNYFQSTYIWSTIFYLPIHLTGKRRNQDQKFTRMLIWVRMGQNTPLPEQVIKNFMYMCFQKES